MTTLCFDGLIWIQGVIFIYIRVMLVIPFVENEFRNVGESDFFSQSAVRKKIAD